MGANFSRFLSVFRHDTLVFYVFITFHVLCSIIAENADVEFVFTTMNGDFTVTVVIVSPIQCAYCAEHSIVLVDFLVVFVKWATCHN